MKNNPLDLTPVIFRAFPDGEVLALFPALPADLEPRRNCLSYAHVGQHGAASVALAERTRAATPAESAPLAHELEARGYNLRPCKRFTRAHLRARLAEIEAMK